MAASGDHAVRWNAKYASPEKVAATFIPPRAAWDTLRTNGHTLLFGARGAGKTTLLKMLQPRALAAWNHPEAASAVEAIDYTGVFVTTDRAWRGQVSAAASQLPDTDRASLGLATFSTHVLKAVALAAADRVEGSAGHLNLAMTPHEQAAIVADVADAWEISKPTATFRSLARRLTDRLAGVARLLETPEAARTEHWASVLPSFEHQSAALVLIERFNDAAGDPDALWCFLFDELELAPHAVVNHLQRGLRGGDSKILYKLSLAPFTEALQPLEQALAGQTMHDYRVVSLTYPQKTAGYDFCRALLAAQFGKQPGELEEDKILGTSVFETPPSHFSGAPTAYSADSDLVERMRHLASRDESFKRWLGEQNVDLDHPEKLSSQQRAQTLRKIRPLVTVREAYRTRDAIFERTRRRRRSRKTMGLYGGALALYAIVEGNPRWFMSLMEPLVNDFNRTRRVNQSLQAEQIHNTTQVFRAVLTAIPVQEMRAKRISTGVVNLLDTIGDRLSRQLIDEEFTSDPWGAFRVDATVPDEQVELLRFALNSGGIVHLPPEGTDGVLRDIRGEEFRLAYTLAPLYQLTLTLGRGINLSSLLGGDGPDPGITVQLELDLMSDEPQVDAPSF